MRLILYLLLFSIENQTPYPKPRYDCFPLSLFSEFKFFNWNQTEERQPTERCKQMECFLFYFYFYFLNFEIWFRFWYCGLIGFDLGRTNAWHWFVKPLLFLIRVILGRVPMVVFLWFFKFLSLNYLTNLPSLASCWPLVLCSLILYRSTKVSFFFLILCFLMKFRWIPVAYFGFSIVIQVLCIRISK